MEIMTGIICEIFIYRTEEVTNTFANYLIDEVYRKKKLMIMNKDGKNKFKKR